VRCTFHIGALTCHTKIIKVYSHSERTISGTGVHESWTVTCTSTRTPHRRSWLLFLSNPEDFSRSVTLCLRLAEEVHRQGSQMKDFQVPHPRRRATWTNSSVPLSGRAITTPPLAGWCAARMGVSSMTTWMYTVYENCAYTTPLSSRALHRATPPVIVVAEKCADLMKSAPS
jgi:hypothetical protein